MYLNNVWRPEEANVYIKSRYEHYLSVVYQSMSNPEKFIYYFVVIRYETLLNHMQIVNVKAGSTSKSLLE